MMNDLVAKEREIANRFTGDVLLKGRSVPMGTVFWAAKLAAIVDDNDTWGPNIGAMAERLSES